MRDHSPRHSAAAMAATVVAAFVLLLAVAGFARVGAAPHATPIIEATNVN